jgi:hypothetical protein
MTATPPRRSASCRPCRRAEPPPRTSSWAPRRNARRPWPSQDRVRRVPTRADSTDRPVVPNNSARYEEFFGPVAPVYVAKDEEEAIRPANDTPHGLASYVVSQHPEKPLRVADGIDAGMVFINGITAAGARACGHRGDAAGFAGCLSETRGASPPRRRPHPDFGGHTGGHNCQPASRGVTR